MRGEKVEDKKDVIPADKNKQSEDQKIADAERELARQRASKNAEDPVHATPYPFIVGDPDDISKVQETYPAEQLANIVFPNPSTSADNITTGLTQRQRDDAPKGGRNVAAESPDNPDDETGDDQRRQNERSKQQREQSERQHRTPDRTDPYKPKKG